MATGKNVFRKALLGQIGITERDLSPTQERQLLSWHAKHDFSYPYNNLRETMRVLLEKQYLKDKAGNLIVTSKGEEYLDEHSFNILSTKKRPSKEMTPFQKAMLENELIIADKLVKESKKKDAEKGGQMTLFGRMIAKKLAMQRKG